MDLTTDKLKDIIAEISGENYSKTRYFADFQDMDWKDQAEVEELKSLLKSYIRSQLKPYLSDLEGVDDWLMDGPDEPHDPEEYKKSIRSTLTRSRNKANTVKKYTHYFPGEFEEILSEIKSQERNAEVRLVNYNLSHKLEIHFIHVQSSIFGI